MELVIPVVTLIAGAIAGYLFRLAEFVRDRRLAIYSSFVGTFLNAAHAGAALFSLHTQMGETLFKSEHRERVEPWWRSWGEAADSFEISAAQLRLVAGKRVIAEAEKLEAFLETNVRSVPPLRLTKGTEGWGDAAKIGPAEIDREAVRMSRKFADFARPELSSWRGRKGP